MRLSFVLLVAAVTLLASSGTASASGQSKHSVIASLDAAPAKNARFLRSMKAHEDGEERAPLEKLDDLLAKLDVAEANMLATLNRYDIALLKKIDNTSGVKARIQGWRDADWDPAFVANMLKRDFPTLTRDGAEWQAWALYAAQYMRQHHSLNPTV